MEWSEVDVGKKIKMNLMTRISNKKNHLHIWGKIERQRKMKTENSVHEKGSAFCRRYSLYDCVGVYECVSKR